MPTPATPLVLIGVPQATLQCWLSEAQQALHNLQTGTKIATVSYSQGDGQKLVTYQRANIAELERHIRDIAQALGLVGPRRAMGVAFP